ncbi:MAG TPA: iron-containing alcohol dehydrogenase [bacterium]|nr:iron-containing alcohol dehydrogenase [bacterium]
MSAPSMPPSPPRPFRGPSRLWYGEDAVARIGECVAELGIAPGAALLVTDAVVDRLGLARAVADGLTAAGFTLERFADIPGEPTAEVADRAAALARRLSPVLVCGVGGGSVMDVAKLAAALARNPGGVLEYTHEVGRRFSAPSIPTVLVPTTAGTGAEASQNAVITHDGRKAFANSHPHLLAAGVLLDPRLTHSLPKTVTAHTGLDALSHCVEGMLSSGAGPLTDITASQGIGLIVDALPRAYADGGNAEARAQMLLAAYLGGLTLNAGMILGHSIAYTIANRLHLPHGFSCALALPYAMAYSRDAAADRLRRIEDALARARGLPADSAAGHHETRGAGHDVMESEASPAGGDAVRRVQSLGLDVGMPEALRTLGLERERLPELVDECLVRYPRPNNPRPLEREPLLSLYTAMWEGRPADAWRG